MTRVNLEDEAFSDPRFFRLASKLGGNFCLAIGILAFLWRNSQKEMVVKASKIQILDYLATDDETLIQHLVSAKYLIAEDDQFVIVGNQKQIDSLKEYFENKSNAGKKSAEIRAYKKQQKSTGVQQNSTDDEQKSTGVQQNSTDLNRAQPITSTITNTNTNIIQNTEYIDMSTKTEKQPVSASADVGVVTPTTHKKKEPKQLKIKAEKIVELWNLNKSTKFAAIKAITGKRLRDLEKKLESFPDESDWLLAIQNLANWKWANGENSTGWIATFDYLLSEKGTKAFEGNLSGSIQDPKRQLKNNCQTNNEQYFKNVREF